MTWFKLSSVALKYKLTLKKSKLEQLVRFGQVACVVAILFYCTYLTFTLFHSSLFSWVSSPYILMYILVIFFLFIFFIRKRYSFSTYKLGDNTLAVNTIFTLTDTGECQFSITDIRQINPKSRLSFLGAYLVLDNKEKVQLKEKPMCYFIYKDALNLQEYTRLSRAILYCQKPHQDSDS